MVQLSRFFGGLRHGCRVNPLPHFLPRLEMRHPFGWNRDLVTRLGVPPVPWRMVVQRKTPESSDLHPVTMGKRLSQAVDDFRDRSLGIFGREDRKALGQARNEFRSGHGVKFYREITP